MLLISILLLINRLLPSGADCPRAEGQTRSIYRSIYLSFSLSLSLSIYIYIYIYMYVYIYIYISCVYIYIYIYIKCVYIHTHLYIYLRADRPRAEGSGVGRVVDDRHGPSSLIQLSFNYYHDLIIISI